MKVAYLEPVIPIQPSHPSVRTWLAVVWALWMHWAYFTDTGKTNRFVFYVAGKESCSWWAGAESQNGNRDAESDRGSQSQRGYGSDVRIPKDISTRKSYRRSQSMSPVSYFLDVPCFLFFKFNGQLTQIFNLLLIHRTLLVNYVWTNFRTEYLLQLIE